MLQSRPLPVLPLALAASLALPLAVAMPLGLAVFGFMLFGVAHNLAELRYVAGRYVLGRLAGARLLALVGPLLGVLAARAASGSLLDVTDARRLEIALVYGSLALVAASAGRRGRWLALAAVLVGAALSWSAPKLHFLVLAHLHNLMPVLFLLLHSAAGRLRTGLICAVWALVIPGLLLGGALDPWLTRDGLGPVGPLARPEALIASWTRPEWAYEQKLRVVACFSFLQGMHYAIWIGLLPAVSGRPDLQGGPRWARLLFGRWGTGAALLLGLGLLPFFATSYEQAFGFYAVLASFHALVEFPVLLAFLLDRGEPAPAAPGLVAG